MTEGVKYDGDKVRMELLFEGMPEALEAVGQVLTFGGQKYDDHNWKQVANLQTRYRGAAVRHALEQAKGNDRDDETGMLHLAHEACCVLFKLQAKIEEIKCQES